MKNNSNPSAAAIATAEESNLIHRQNDDDYDDSEDDQVMQPTGSSQQTQQLMSQQSSSSSNNKNEFGDISPHPIDVLSHFVIISDASVKTPKYRCKCCKYEFTASSTTRLKQHIMGYDVYSNEATPKKIVKDIKECTNPYLPLKEALIIEFNNNRIHKRSRESIIGSDDGGMNGDSNYHQTPKSNRKKSRHSELPKTPIGSWNGKFSACSSVLGYFSVCGFLFLCL
jgi:hypothetical protein